MEKVDPQVENLSTQIPSEPVRGSTSQILSEDEAERFEPRPFSCEACGRDFWSRIALCFHKEVCPPTSIDIEDEDEEEEDDDDVEDWFRDDDYGSMCVYYATQALGLFNKTAPTMYELVEPGPCCTHPYHRMTHHINFIANKVGRPVEEMEAFFATLSDERRCLVVNSCESLGPISTVPHWRKADVAGCKLCRRLINHPKEWKMEHLLALDKPLTSLMDSDRRLRWFVKENPALQYSVRTALLRFVR